MGDVMDGDAEKCLSCARLRSYQYSFPLNVVPLGSIRTRTPPSIISVNRLRLQLRIGPSMIGWRGINFMINALGEVLEGRS